MKRQKYILPIREAFSGSSIFWWMLWSGLVLIQGCQSSSDAEKNTIPVHQDSLSYYTGLIDKNPNDEAALMARARFFYTRQSYGAALKDLESALRIDSSRLETYLLKSRVEMDYFRSLESLRTLQKAESLWPDSELTKEHLARTLLILKQYDQAAEKAHQALQIRPGAATPYLLLGMIAKEKQDTVTAIRYLQQAVQNDADLLDAWIELARMHTDKNPEEAAVYFESALQIAPDDLLIWHAYGMFWQNMDSLEQAKNAYEKMISIDSTSVEAFLNHALILMDQDSFRSAIPLWNQYIRRRPEEAKGYYYRGISYELTSQNKSALKDYQTARSLDPGLENIDDAIESLEDLE